jgi:hypothetical protein
MSARSRKKVGLKVMMAAEQNCVNQRLGDTRPAYFQIQSPMTYIPNFKSPRIMFSQNDSKNVFCFK